jgi:DNA invertase Pin-like site-specific DNA recombinase
MGKARRVQTANKAALGYVRVSTEEQAREGMSLEAQRARITTWCELNGYTLLGMHEDAGLSGRRADTRPGLQAALEAVTRERAVLVVYSLSRVSRSTRDMLGIAEQLEAAGADLVSLTERIDTTGAAGRMVFRLLAVLNEFERDVIAERVSATLQHKKANGKAVSRAPRGMRLERDADGRNAVAVPDPASDGLRLVARARALRAKGLSLAAVAEQLEREGFRPERGRRFYGSTVRYILNNTLLAAHAAA